MVLDEKCNLTVSVGVIVYAKRGKHVLQIFNCAVCGTKRIYGDTRLHDEPDNLEPSLNCEGACHQMTTHIYNGLAVSCSNMAEALIEQSVKRHWSQANRRFVAVDAEAADD